MRAQNVSPAPPCNVVILTVGWTGSSMLAGLLQRRGFLDRNNGSQHRLRHFRECRAGSTQSKTADDGRHRRELRDAVSPGVVRQGRATCSHGEPFPVYGIHRRVRASCPVGVEGSSPLGHDGVLEEPVADSKTSSTLLLTREPLQAWISCTLRRQIQTLRPPTPLQRLDRRRDAAVSRRSERAAPARRL